MAVSAALNGIVAAILAALLFGASTPLAKLLLGQLPPQMLAGLLYLGSGLGLGLATLVRPPKGSLHGREWLWLAAAILAGGVLGPVLLMHGLLSTPASTSSLLLNLEGVFTALLAWFVMRENFDRRIALGMVAIVSGGLLLSWEGSLKLAPGALLVVAACFCWAVDNNLTQKVSGGDPLRIAALKGGAAGACNLAIAALLHQVRWPGALEVAGAGLVGFFGYGVSLVLFVLALRHLGSARTGAYFSLAPFAGAALSLVLFRDPIHWRFLVAAALMAVGVYLHLTEHHEHEHVHEDLEHTHEHVHDEHHQHEHGSDTPSGEPHTHFHRHRRLVHSHPHYPDIHHRHSHD
ncbi:MAG: hypothetical protein AMXMBFR33_20590 [Candidatus Xenobia bacterium]